MYKKDFAYLKIYERLREEITRGAYKYGDRLPSKRSLAEASGTSVITVCHAYDILCDEGYAESRERSGYYVIFNNDNIFPVAQSIPKNEFHQHHAISEEFPFTVFSKTIRKVISEYGEIILEKSPSFGLIKLRQEVCSYLARSRDIFTKPENIIIGAGAEYFYSLLVQIFGKDTLFGIENPSYDKIERVYSACGGKCDPLKMGASGIETRELERTKAKILHITPFNSFPSGITATASKRREYLRWAEKQDRIIIEDDFDSEFSGLTKQEDTVFSLSDNENVLYMNTFSKTIAPSIRMGYMVVPDKLLPLFTEKIGFYSCTVSVLEQLIVSEIIGSGDFERHLNRTRRKRRNSQKRS